VAEDGHALVKAALDETPAKVRGDNPIRQPADDRLGRVDTARSFARQILGLDTSEGVVVGVLGPWGSGKTSFVNLARPEFERAAYPLLEFNPWMFSGAEQLVESFFIELAAQLKIRPDLANLGKDLEDYGDVFSGMAWLPLIGPWIERGRGAIKIIGKILQHRKEGVGLHRAKLEEALRKLKKPILVFLDDIDRLSTPEIRDVFKLIRLTASFPNVIYIVAFDRPRVEQALTEQGVPGRAYLEKILQVTIDLPSIPDNVLSGEILSAANDALVGIENPGPFNESAWVDLFSEIVRPLVRNMRDVRRYAVAVKGAAETLGGQVALADILALEAIRVFVPDVFVRLPSSVDGLTTSSGLAYGSRGESPALKIQIDSLIQADPAHADVVRAMIKRLFPAGERHIGGSHYAADWKSRWLRDRRVAHEEILRLYMERIAGESLLAFADAEKAWAHFSDRHALDTYLRSLDEKKLQDVIASFETYEDQFAAEHVIPGVIVLLNLLPSLPERRRQMLEPGARWVVARVTYRLLKCLQSPDAVEAAIHQILPELTSISSKLEVITEVGHREGAGHKLVSQSAAAGFERSLRDEVRTASAEQLAKEYDLLRLLVVTKREADPSEGQITIDASPEMTLALLRSAWSETLGQSLGSRAVRRSPQLAWEILTELYGNEFTLRERIENLKMMQPGDADELLKLAEKYLSGWRPNRFGED
jgi:predicted KAP-like P-loop ATPase